MCVGDSYDFHGCELLQSIVENRPQGAESETNADTNNCCQPAFTAAGVVSVQLVKGVIAPYLVVCTSMSRIV